jgi:hypothetical protein
MSSEVANAIANASANTPARAVIAHGEATELVVVVRVRRAERCAACAAGDVTRAGSVSGSVEQRGATSPIEHASPRMKAAARKRRAAEAGADTEGTVCRGDPDTLTAGGGVNTSTLQPAPSGRGEVGGPMIPAGGEVAIASCLGDSVAHGASCGLRLRLWRVLCVCALRACCVRLRLRVRACCVRAASCCVLRVALHARCVLRACCRTALARVCACGARVRACARARVCVCVCVHAGYGSV